MSDQIQLEGKSAIVTGGGRGLGAAMARALIEAGASVTSVDVNANDLQNQLNAAEFFEGPGRLTVLAGDLRDAKFCRAAVEQSGGPDILVNNAALLPSYVHPGRLLAGGVKRRFWELEDEVVKAVMDVNFIAADRMARICVPHMLNKGWGRIVNVCTRLETMNTPGSSPYGPSKAALEMASEVWMKELVGTGVTVNLLSPGAAADTPGFATEEEKTHRLRDPKFHMMPAHKMGPPIVWLASDRANAINGMAFEADKWDGRNPPEAEAARLGRPIGLVLRER